MFIIHKNGNETSIQPIIKWNSTSFMFNENVCEIYIKKDPLGEDQGEWGNHPNSFLEV